MLRLFLNSLSSLALLASGLLLWQSDFFPEKLPHAIGAWLAGLFGLFHEPYTAMILYGLTLLIVIGSWFITEILLSLLYSIVAAGMAWICLLGFLSVHYPPIYHYIQTLAK